MNTLNIDEQVNPLKSIIVKCFQSDIKPKSCLQSVKHHNKLEYHCELLTVLYAVSRDLHDGYGADYYNYSLKVLRLAEKGKEGEYYD